MNCREARDLIGSALDGVLSPSLKDFFEAHLAVCGACKREFELESIAKNIVHDSLVRVPTPSSIRNYVLQSLADPSSEGRLPHLSLRAPRPIILSLSGLALAAAAFFWFVNPFGPPSDSTVHTASNDVINQTLNNFQLVQSGKIRPELSSCFPETILRYFQKNNVQFAVHFLHSDDCDWYGAFVTEYNGVRLAHIIYRIGDDIVYCYQVRGDDVTRGTTLSLPPAARTALAQTGWYNDPLHPSCNIVIWKDRETLCAAASTMKKDRLAALVASR